MLFSYKSALVKMEKRFPFQKREKNIYKMWEENNFFKPVLKNKKGKFSIIMPPPNANDSLHLGHAVFTTIEDIMVRYNRMLGKATLWVPGADHAGFETQVVFEKKLEKEGKSRFQLPNNVLYKMMWNFTQKNKKTMEGQLRSLGASCDWSKEKFTLDPDVIKTVYQTFKSLFKKGLIYRGKRVINWCPYHQTSFSDLEVIYQEEKTKLVYIKYPVFIPSNAKEKLKSSFSPKNFITVATTRPETMLGDTAIAVNPKDKRYQLWLKNKIKIRLPLTDRIIPLVADEVIDPSFGTGAVKVTPAHDPTDFEIGTRHNLEVIQVIGKDGRMTKESGPDYSNLKVNEARKKIVKELKELNLIKKEEKYTHSAPLCYKCKRHIEPLVSDQWFIKIKPLAEKAVAAVKKGEVKFISKRFEKIFFNWMKEIRDWNISRQIVWGIKIPVWYCQEQANKKCRNKNGVILSEKKIKRCPYCQSKNIKRETDTFDTWFSSSQWPFIALGFPNSKNYKYFYPTSIMETGWDILFFWVARMIMMGIYQTGKVPFYKIYLHGLIRDKNSQKMSKSKGNVIDPLSVIKNYGADALRMALVFGSDPQNDIVISEEKIIAQQRFATKLWNASRFILENFEKSFTPKKVKTKSLKLTKNDKWIIKELKKITKKETKNIESFKFHKAAEEIYHFFWHKFCDKYIENAKKRLYSEKASQKEKETAQWVLYNVLLDSLKLLHPFMPFITEDIYQKLPFRFKKALIIENWPK